MLRALGWAHCLRRDVRHILVQIREDQQQLEHSIALVFAALGRLDIQIVHDRQRIGEQPFETDGVNGLAGATPLERLIGPFVRFVEKMIQAKLLSGKTVRD
jgi:hypothetical protein